jgi:hypothetical protein
LVPPPGAAAPFECRLHHPSAWTPSEQQSAQVLPLPPALQALLGMMLHLNTCYGFLLAQHIQPSWPRLVSLMSRLFPQVGEWDAGGGGEEGEGGAQGGRGVRLGVQWPIECLYGGPVGAAHSVQLDAACLPGEQAVASGGPGCVEVRGVGEVWRG